MENNINELINKAYTNSINKNFMINDSLSLKQATVDGAWKKHGFQSSCGSYIKNIEYDPEFLEIPEQAWVEDILFKDKTACKGDTSKGHWRKSFFSASKNLAILKIDLHEAGIHGFEAFMNAAELETLPKDKLCKVEALGSHPTLVTDGDAQQTSVITAIIELDGSLDPDLGAACSKLKGEPILVTWFPGKSLPVSAPHDCSVGDTLTVEEALEKGWKTVAFASEN